MPDLPSQSPRRSSVVGHKLTHYQILEGTGVMDGRGLQGTIDDSIQREVMRKTTLLPEFQQGPTEFVRSKSKKNSGKSELLVVSERSPDERNRNKSHVPADRAEGD